MKIFKALFSLSATLWVVGVADAYEKDKPYTGELHPPVIATVGEKKIAIVFIKNNFKKMSLVIMWPQEKFISCLLRL